MCGFGGCQSFFCEKCKPKFAMCKGCGKQVYLSSKACPECGEPLTDSDKDEARLVWQTWRDGQGDVSDIAFLMRIGGIEEIAKFNVPSPGGTPFR